MPRANRHYTPGQVWHITHRCHKRDFLLGFRKDRRRWQHRLFEAKKRFGLQVLNYTITSNHIHLLVVDGEEREVLPRSLQLIASRTGQEYNHRKKRQGAFWEDRYHATAVESGEHFVRCLIYIDLNMVRAGVVGHPSEWQECGYHEIFNPPQRYAIINHQKLVELAMVQNLKEFKNSYAGWLQEMQPSLGKGREDKWSSSIAVGSEEFVTKIKLLLGIKAEGRNIVKTTGGASELREASSSYNSVFMLENGCLSIENSYYWDF